MPFSQLPRQHFCYATACPQVIEVFSSLLYWICYHLKNNWEYFRWLIESILNYSIGDFWKMYEWAEICLLWVSNIVYRTERFFLMLFLLLWNLKAFFFTVILFIIMIKVHIFFCFGNNSKCKTLQLAFIHFYKYFLIQPSFTWTLTQPSILNQPDCPTQHLEAKLLCPQTPLSVLVLSL